MAGTATGLNLREFEIAAARDLAKTVQELVHQPCGHVLCDVEPGDNLQTLAAIAADHPCHRRWSDTPAPELRGCMEDGYTAEDVNRVFGQIHHDCGITLVCVWDDHDAYGPGGNSQFYVDTGSGTLLELAGELWRWLNENPHSPNSPPHPGAPTTWAGDLVEFCLDDLPWHDGRHNYAVRHDT